MKKLWVVLLAVMLMSMMTACSVAEETENSVSAVENEVSEESGMLDDISEESSEKSITEKVPEETSSNGVLGDYAVEILSARKGKDYEDKDIIIVKYKFTNNGEEATSFLTSILNEAYQDGIQLETAITLDDIDTENQMKNIKTGASIECEIGYVLDSESDIEIEVSELFSFDDNKITKVFTMSEIE